MCSIDLNRGRSVPAVNHIRTFKIQNLVLDLFLMVSNPNCLISDNQIGMMAVVKLAILNHPLRMGSCIRTA